MAKYEYDVTVTKNGETDFIGTLNKDRLLHTYPWLDDLLEVHIANEEKLQVIVHINGTSIEIESNQIE